MIALLLFVAFIVTGYMLPTRAHVERSIIIERPANMLFAILNSYRHYEQWSPWAARDPNAEFAITGPDAGVGARLSWMGDPHLVGSGWQEIIASKPYERIEMKLDYDSQGIARSSFLLQSSGDATRITWAFDSDLTEGLNFFEGFLARYFGLLFDRWVGNDYEQGLANLKRFAESRPVSDFSQIEISRLHVAAQDILFVSTSSSDEPAEIATAMASAYEEIGEFMNEAGISMQGQPMAITRLREEGIYQFDAAIPVDVLPVEVQGQVRAGKSPSGDAVRAIHHGDVSHMMPSYEKLTAYMSAHGLSHGGVSWEHYISDPRVTETQNLVTHIYIMLDENVDH
jgi:effector-binding domain-containing protein